MQARQPNVFAFGRSGLGAFLYADVGVEANGSTLTILSTLARLGKDPWAEAERWASLPRAVAIDSLAQSIAAMPLEPSAPHGARDSAARLVQLLPRNVPSLRPDGTARSATAVRKAAPVTILYFAFAVWLALNVIIVSNPSSGVQASTNSSTATSEASRTPPKSPAEGAAVAASFAAPIRR